MLTKELATCTMLSACLLSTWPEMKHLQLTIRIWILSVMLIHICLFGYHWMSLTTQRSLRTPISVRHIKIKPGDSLDTFSCLRTLHIQDANVDALAKSWVQLKHLRYLSITDTQISMLPENIGKMMLLQYIRLMNCWSLTKLPGSIGQLRHLRLLNLSSTPYK
jgi:Leucine-rich repeat (LRR) protein